MFTKFFVAAAALPLLAGSAIAGPYVNTEVESDFAGNDYEGSSIETRVGYEGEINERTEWFVELGPTVFFEDGVSGEEVELGVEVGAEFAVTDKLGVYGEVEFFTGEEVQTSTTVGARYTF